MSKEEDERSTQKGYRLLGILDVQNTPCAREAVLHGAGASLAAGLLHFLVTSRVKRSFDVGAGGFLLGTFSSWCYCRYSNARQRAQQRMVQHGVRNRIIYQGTPADPQNSQSASGPS
ncbi:cytochrome c oxidase assembly protein COX20, mitochondrial [Vanacampus margaritifer]